MNLDPVGCSTVKRKISELGDESSDEGREGRPPRKVLVLGRGKIFPEAIDLFTLSILNWTSYEEYSQSLYVSALYRERKGEFKIANDHLLRILSLYWDEKICLSPAEEGRILIKLGHINLAAGLFFVAESYMRAAHDLRQEGRYVFNESERVFLEYFCRAAHQRGNALRDLRYVAQEQLDRAHKFIGDKNPISALTTLNRLMDYKFDGKYIVLSRHQYGAVWHLAGCAYNLLGDYHRASICMNSALWIMNKSDLLY